MASKTLDDLAFVKPDGLPDGADPSGLYADELAAYSAFDGEDAHAYDRRVRHAFLVRELSQIDDIVKERKSYAHKIFCLVVGWLAALGVVMLLAGWGVWGFFLDAKVLLALIGGTTINVLGIFVIVTKFLFPAGGHSILSRADKADSASAMARPRQAARKKKVASDASVGAPD